MSVSATNSSDQAQSSSSTDVTASGYDAFQDVGIEDFLKLMTTELQNQDPLNPMDNTQMLEQIGQIREIASNDSLSNTLESVMLGQNVSTASGMLKETVEALDDEGVRFTGQVTKVTIADGIPTLHCTETIPEHEDALGNTVAEQVIEHTVKLKNVYGVVPAEEIEKIDPTVLPQQLSAASALVNKTVIAGEGQEIVTKEEDGKVTTTRGDVVSSVAGVVEKTIVEDGQAKVQILVPAPEPTEGNPEPKDKRYIVALSEIQQVVSGLSEELAIGASMVGREVVGKVNNDGEETALGGRIQQVYIQDGKVMLAVQPDDGTGNLYGLSLEEVTNVFNYVDPYEVTEETSET